MGTALSQQVTTVLVIAKKKGSSVRSHITEHVKLSASLWSRASDFAPLEMKMPNPPFFYEKPIWFYVRHFRFAERLIRSIGMAKSASKDELQEIMRLLPREVWDHIAERINLFRKLQVGLHRSKSIFGWNLEIEDPIFGDELLENFKALLLSRDSLVTIDEPAKIPHQSPRRLGGEVVPTQINFSDYLQMSKLVSQVRPEPFFGVQSGVKTSLRKRARSKVLSVIGRRARAKYLSKLVGPIRRMRKKA